MQTPPGAVATHKPTCSLGSRPESGLQDHFSKAEHESDRAKRSYDYNIEVVGSYTDKAGRDCAYYDTTLTYPSNFGTGESGVNLLDMIDPTKPLLTAQLEPLAMLSPHESLKMGLGDGQSDRRMICMESGGVSSRRL